MESKKTSVTLQTALLNMAKQAYGTENASYAIQSAMNEAVLKPTEELLKLSDRGELIYSVLKKPSERKEKRTVAFHYDADVADVIRHVGGLNMSEAVRLSLLVAVDQKKKGKTEAPSTEPDNLKTYLVQGNKFNKKLRSATKSILESVPSNVNCIVDICAGALGSFSAYHDPDKKMVLNDKDIRKINFIKSVQQNPAKVKALCLKHIGYDHIRNADSFKIDNATLKKYNEQIDSYLSNCKKYNEDAAALYLLTNLFSVRNKGASHRELSADTYFKRIDNIGNLSRALNDVVLSKKDIFSVIRKYCKSKEYLLVVDPPYIDTDGYLVYTGTGKTKQSTLEAKEHKKLAKLLRNGDARFIYFCRITGANNWSDDELKGFIDDNYCNYGLYFKDVDISTSDRHIVERIITNFPFEGGSLYDDQKGRW